MKAIDNKRLITIAAPILVALVLICSIIALLCVQYRKKQNKEIGSGNSGNQANHMEDDNKKVLPNAHTIRVPAPAPAPDGGLKNVGELEKKLEPTVKNDEANKKNPGKIFYRKAFDDNYVGLVNSLKKSSLEDLKQSGIEYKRDLIQILLVFELKRDKNIQGNEKKIALINEIGKVLAEEVDISKKILGILNREENKNIVDSRVLIENIRYFLNSERFKCVLDGFKNVDRTADKDGEKNNKFRAKNGGGFIRLKVGENRNKAVDNDFYIKKILKPGLKNKDFSESKYVNLHKMKSEKLSRIKKNVINIDDIETDDNDVLVFLQNERNHVIEGVNDERRTVKKINDKEFHVVNASGITNQVVRTKLLGKYLNKNKNKKYTKEVSIYNELYISEIIKVLFPEYHYKIREFRGEDTGGVLGKKVIFKLVEGAKDLKTKGPTDGLELDLDKQLHNQSMFDSLALMLFFNLNDRCFRNFLYREDENGLARVFNIDFEFLKDNEDSYKGHFVGFFRLIKDINNKREDVMKILKSHINTGNPFDTKPTSQLYKKFFDNITQEQINECAKNFLARFTPDNLKKIQEINAVYSKKLENEEKDKEVPYPHGPNKVLTGNIELVMELKEWISRG